MIHFTALLPTARSSQEKARIHVVYALLGTVVFMPLQLFVMEAFFLAALVLAARYVWCYDLPDRTRPILFVPAAAFAVVALLSLAGSPRLFLGLAFYAFTVLQYFLLFCLLQQFVRGEAERKLLVYGLLLSTALVALYGFYQYAHMLTLREEEWVDNSAFPLLRRRMYSTLYNPNLLSAYLLMVMSAAGALVIRWWGRWKQAAPFALLLAALTLCLVLTYSRGAWISACALIFFFGLVWDKRLWLSFLVIPLVLAFHHGGVTRRLLSIFSQSAADTSVSMRMDMWLAALQMTADHPLLGIGWGAFKYVYPVYNELIQEAGITIFHAHNMYLNVLAETGLLGFTAYFWFYFGVVWYAIRFLHRYSGTPFDRALVMAVAGAMLAVAVSGFSDYDLFSTQISLTLWLFAGLLTNTYEEYRKNQKKSLRNNSQ